MNRLKPEKQAMVLSALVEGTSIRSIERMTGVHRDTIMRLMVRVGQTCREVQDVLMRDLPCKRIEMDEIWCYVGKKEGVVSQDDDPSEVGDFWTWVALDPDTKIVPAYHIGKRTRVDADRFTREVARRLANRVQLSTDGLSHYITAVERAFGGQVDYAMIVKSFKTEQRGSGRYSPPREVRSVDKTAIVGKPDWDLVSTSGVERQNLTMRMQMRRFTRLTNGFSKKRANLEAAVALHFGWYNFIRQHRSLGTTPAVAAGVSQRAWTMGDLVELAG